MNRVEHVAGELNKVCVMVCFLAIVLYWMPEFPPDLYAYIKGFFEVLTADPFDNFRGDRALEPYDFVNLKI